MAELLEFQSAVSALASTMSAAENFAADLQKKVVLIRQTLHNTPGTPEELKEKASDINQQLEDVIFIFEGPQARASREEIPPYPMPLNRRLGALVYAHYSSTSEVTKTEKDNYEILKDELQPVLEKLSSVYQEIKALNDELDDIGAPWTPGRIPAWK
jgi:septation ring formation regulator EzrA